MAQAPNLPLGAGLPGPSSPVPPKGDASPSDSAGVKPHASGFSKQFFSPDILKTLKPPGTGFTLDNSQHRFCAEYEVDSRCLKNLPKEYQNKHFSRSFANSKDWKDCLQKVHAWLWGKYSALPGKAQAKCTVQEPGSIPDATLLELENVVSAMPPLKKYKATSAT